MGWLIFEEGNPSVHESRIIINKAIVLHPKTKWAKPDLECEWMLCNAKTITSNYKPFAIGTRVLSVVKAHNDSGLAK